MTRRSGRFGRPGRLLAGVTAGLAAAVVALPLAAEAAERLASDVEMMDEAWFYRYRQPLADAPDDSEQTDPGGHTPIGIGKATTRDASGEVYPGEFVRVGVNAGEEEARAYLTLPLFELGEGLPAIVTGGRLRLVAAPADAARGQRNADGADMLACLTVELVVSDHAGDWEDLPEIDCGVHAPLEPVDGAERPSWTVDLAPFAPTWQDPERNFGLAVVANPDSELTAAEQTWHVAFPTRFNDEVGPSPTADVRYRVEEPPTFVVDDLPPEDLAAFGDGDTPLGPVDAIEEDVAFEDDVVAYDEAFEDEAVHDAPPVASEPDPARQSQRPGLVAPTTAAPVAPRTNPVLYLLPLLGLGLATLVGYSLTKEPVLPDERHGAVSTLVERQAGRR